MNFEQMEIISAGGKNRTCMILGGVATAGVIGSFFVMSFIPVAGAAIVGAAMYGCFD